MIVSNSKKGQSVHTLVFVLVQCHVFCKLYLISRVYYVSGLIIWSNLVCICVTAGEKKKAYQYEPISSEITAVGTSDA